MLAANLSGGIAISPCESSPSTLFSCGLSNCATSNFTIDTNNVDIVLRDSQIAALGLVYDNGSASGSPSSSIPASSTASTTTTSDLSTATSNTVFSGTICASTSSASTSSADNALTVLQNSDNTKLIGVGVGIGVSLGLALIGALALFGLEKARNNRLATEHAQISLERTTLQERVRWYETQDKRRPVPTYGLSEDGRPNELSAGIPAQELSDSISHSGHRPAYRG